MYRKLIAFIIWIAFMTTTIIVSFPSLLEYSSVLNPHSIFIGFFLIVGMVYFFEIPSEDPYQKSDV